MSPEAAEAFRGFMAVRRAAPAADEESFRLLTGFNDIFVTVAIVLVLVALNWLALPNPLLAPPLTAGLSWGLAEFFTRRRRMALPSILLLLSFVGSVGLGATMLTGTAFHGSDASVAWSMAGVITCAALAGAAAAYAHWRRFRVPVTVAAGTLAATAFLASGVTWAFPALLEMYGLVVLAAGLGVFAVAMWWDASDRLRQTGRSDAAFWLHLLAAPMIVHPLFLGLGLLQASVPPSKAVAGLACYLVLAAVALTVDRRAILVSALAYVLWAMQSLLSGVGTLSTAFAIAALGIGGCLLLLSAFWQNGRRLVLPALPRWIRNRVPPV